MSTSIQWRIPPGLSHWLEQVPNDRPVAILLRHSIRDELPTGQPGAHIPLTADGERIATELGVTLGARLRGLHTSPVFRCVQTAEAIRIGAGATLPINYDRLLGAPGIFVLDGDRAWTNWQQYGHEQVMHRLTSRNDAMPGMARPDSAARFLVTHMLAATRGKPGIHLFITHDSLLLPTAAHLLGYPLDRNAWPWFLDGALFWREDDGLHAAYCDYHRSAIPETRHRLHEHDVIEFARRELATTVGFDSGARFFLAGGAFKTLLTGRPPRDLDLWAPSDTDRKRLIAALLKQGAQRLPPRPFTDAFEAGDRIIEVAHKTQPSVLVDRLKQFDIALSAIGVEHSLRGQDGQWVTEIHPLARVSAERRQVLLLKPLVNRNFALATLERARRYAAELGFQLPSAEEAEVWQLFNQRTPEGRQGMLERFKRVSRGGFSVLEEAQDRTD